MEQQDTEYWKSFLPVAEALSQGKEIQFRSREAADAWHTFKVSPSAGRLDFSRYEFRPKPEIRWRPFKNASEFSSFRERWVIHRGDPTNGPMKVLAYDDHRVMMSMLWFTYQELFEKCDFQDGHPCGTFDDEFFLVSDPEPKHTESAS